MSVDFYAIAPGQERPINLGVDDEDLQLNMGNMSARAVLVALGLLQMDENMWSVPAMEVSWFRRGLMLANNTQRPEALQVEPTSDGRFHDCGLSVEQIRRHLARLETWLDAMVSRGATHIYWG